MSNVIAPLKPLLILSCLTLFLMVCPTQAWAEIPPARQTQLIHLLRHDCGSCHGMSLKGGLGPPLTAQALAERSVEQLEFIIGEGVPERAMPPWKSLLTQPEIRWLAELLLTGDIP